MDQIEISVFSPKKVSLPLFTTIIDQINFYWADFYRIWCWWKWWTFSWWGLRYVQRFWDQYHDGSPELTLWLCWSQPWRTGLWKIQKVCTWIKIEQSFSWDSKANRIRLFIIQRRVKKIPSSQLYKHDNLLGLLIKATIIQEQDRKIENSNWIKSEQFRKSLKASWFIIKQWKTDIAHWKHEKTFEK